MDFDFDFDFHVVKMLLDVTNTWIVQVVIHRSRSLSFQSNQRHGERERERAREGAAFSSTSASHISRKNKR
jgi:hypothetical protein